MAEPRPSSVVVLEDAGAVRNDGPVLDAAFLGRQTAGDKALERELLALFLAQADLLVPRIVAGEPDRTELCHRLTGAGRAIGAIRFAGAAERVGAAEAGATLLADAFAALRPVIAQRLA